MPEISEQELKLPKDQVLGNVLSEELHDLMMPYLGTNDRSLIASKSSLGISTVTQLLYKRIDITKGNAHILNDALALAKVNCQKAIDHAQKTLHSLSNYDVDNA